MFVKFFPPMDKFVALHAPTLRLLKKFAEAMRECV